jgi:hypothetical protein
VSGVDLDALEKAALEATGGDWRAHITTSRSPEIYTNVPPPNTPNPLIAGRVLRKRDATFIAAANPETVLVLIAAARERDDFIRKLNLVGTDRKTLATEPTP